jgi:uroporphyrinogen-III synthase
MSDKCEHATKSEHIEAELAQWSKLSHEAFLILVSASAAKYALEHWDEWMAEAEFQPETREMLDKDWFEEHIVASQTSAAMMLELYEAAGIDIDLVHSAGGIKL